jgi:hypothetical protein
MRYLVELYSVLLRRHKHAGIDMLKLTVAPIDRMQDDQIVLSAQFIPLASEEPGCFLRRHTPGRALSSATAWRLVSNKIKNLFVWRTVKLHDESLYCMDIQYE